MSLVILTNDAKEQSSVVSKTQSIYKPWSFRNSLSSTMEIPANSQIAMTSAKISLDGQISLSEASKTLYIYLGRWLTEGQDLEHSCSYPIKVKLFEDQPGTTTIDTQGLADELQRAINQNISHPNYAKRCAVKVKRNTGTGKFEGYEIQFKQLDVSTTLLPSVAGSTEMIANSVDLISERVRNTPLNRSYTITNSGTNNDVILTPTEFRRKIHGTTFTPSKSVPPASLTKGEIEFDVSRCIGTSQPGATNYSINFACGLSRYYTTKMDTFDDRLGPSYFKWDTSQITTGPRGGQPFDGPFKFGTFYGDFVVANCEGVLRLFDTATNGRPARQGRGGNANSVRWREIDYTQGGTRNAPFDFVYNAQANASRFERIRFTLDGERVKIELITGQPQVFTLYEYSQTRDDGITPRLEAENLKPIDQGCEAMMPLMGINNFHRRNDGIPVGDFNIKLKEYSSATFFDKPNLVYTTDLATYQADPDNTVIPWYNRIEQELSAEAGVIIPEIDRRSQKRTVVFGDTTAQDQFQNCWKPVIIASPSSQYFHTEGANSMRLIGLSSINGIASGEPIWSDDGETNDQFVYTLVSTDTPTALSSKSIFVRVDNFNQTTVNAGNGNKSSIVAHLPRFDGQEQTGRLFFEPKNLIYLDLNNPAPMKINSFDISFVYADESYCTSLVGTSIITLHIRKKSSTD